MNSFKQPPPEGHMHACAVNSHPNSFRMEALEPTNLGISGRKGGKKSAVIGREGTRAKGGGREAAPLRARSEVDACKQSGEFWGRAGFLPIRALGNNGVAEYTTVAYHSRQITPCSGGDKPLCGDGQLACWQQPIHTPYLGDGGLATTI